MRSHQDTEDTEEGLDLGGGTVTIKAMFFTTEKIGERRRKPEI